MPSGRPTLTAEATDGLELRGYGPEIFADDRRRLGVLAAMASRAWQGQQLAQQAAQAHQVAETDRVRSALLTAVSHDLRTPLAGQRRHQQRHHNFLRAATGHRPRSRHTAGAVGRDVVPFQRLGDHDATASLGLGLAIAQGFTEAVHAELTPSAAPGGGLTMTITLPVAP